MANRMLRADSEIAKKLSEIFSSQIRDPNFDSNTRVLQAKTSPDFRYCKVTISAKIHDSQANIMTLKILKKSTGFIKKQLADSLNMPHVPDLVFVIDKGQEHFEKIDSILNSLVIPKESEDSEGDNQ